MTPPSFLLTCGFARRPDVPGVPVREDGDNEKEQHMKKLWYAASFYAAVGLVSGLVYRTLTAKMTEIPSSRRRTRTSWRSA